MGPAASFFFFSSRRRHTRFDCDWSSDVCSSDLRSLGSASLSSSIHLVCRPRESPDGSLPSDEIGDWREVLQELPRRIHEWMPRLAEEGVVGADAIFACLGPALEIFSSFSCVEKASGDAVTLKEYLEHVWAAVAKEALVLVFKDADTAGFEPDARLTAMWLWTLNETDGDGESRGSTSVSRSGDTVLDRIHQSMILFAAGRGEALKRFLVEDGAGRDQRFWKLAQALSALYPSSTAEKRWIDGVLARK